jgi:hypothetical protein
VLGPQPGGEQAQTDGGSKGCEKESGDSRRDAGGPAPRRRKMGQTAIFRRERVVAVRVLPKIGTGWGVRGGTPEPVPDFRGGEKWCQSPFSKEPTPARKPAPHF